MQVRETLEAMQFGEAAGRVPLAPRRRTEVTASGHLSKLQALLDAAREEKAELASDTASLQRQVSGRPSTARGASHSLHRTPCT